MYSGDSTTTLEEFGEEFSRSCLDKVAITDHLTCRGARELHRVFGDRVIIGQEFRVREGEMIALFIEREIPPSLDAREASKRIRSQGGLVYIPHPGDKNRSSMDFETLSRLSSEGFVDIIEVANSKIQSQLLMREATDLAQKHEIAMAAGSDSHVPSSLASSFVKLKGFHDPSSLLASLSGGTYIHHSYCDPPRTWRARILPSIAEGEL